MPRIILTTQIKAPVERVFDLARSIDFHLHSSPDAEKVVAEGKAEGLLELNDSVTWEGSRFGAPQSLLVRVIQMEPPHCFVDEMVEGAFRRLRHTHTFEEQKAGCLMTDEFDYQSRGGPLGWIIENSFLTASLRRLLSDRNKILKQAAESDEWKEFLSSDSN